MNKELILSTLDKQLFKVKKYKLNTGSGLNKKIKRLFLLKEKYIFYIFWKFFKFDKQVSANILLHKKIILPLNDPNARHLYFFGCLGTEEIKLTKYLIKNIKENDIFYDIGANYGYYTYLVSSLVTIGEVHSFEPHPYCYSYLKKNTSTINNCYVNELAVSNSISELPLFGKKISHHMGSSDSSLIKKVIQSKHVQQIAIIKTMTLDTYIKDHKKPTFLKIDIEGTEYKALLGAKELLTQTDNLIISMEIWANDRGIEFSLKPIKFLKSLNFHSYEIDIDGNLHQYDIDVHNLKNGFVNTIWKKNEK